MSKHTYKFQLVVERRQEKNKNPTRSSCVHEIGVDFWTRIGKIEQNTARHWRVRSAKSVDTIQWELRQVGDNHTEVAL